MEGFEIKKFIQRYMNLANALKDKTIDKVELDKRLQTDINMIQQLYSTKQMDDNEYQSVLETIDNFEDIYEAIHSMQKSNSNGQSK